MIGWLGWLGSALVVVSLSLDDQRAFRFVNLAASSVMLTVNAMIGMTSMVVLNVVLIAINARQIARMRAATRRVDVTAAACVSAAMPVPPRAPLGLAHTDQSFATAA